MKSDRKRLNIILSILAILMGGTAAILFWLPPSISLHSPEEKRYGLSDDRELVKKFKESGKPELIVEDASGEPLFSITLKNCIVESKYRNGRLLFRDTVTGNEGFFDRNGVISFIQNDNNDLIHPEISQAEGNETAPGNEDNIQGFTGTTKINDVELQTIGKSNPFRHEALKILSGRLEENDSLRRKLILNYCEHFRTAYTTRDIDFLRQVFSDNALIIVGNVVKSGKEPSEMIAGNKVRYSVHSKASYLERLSRVFKTNKKIKVEFSDFRIMRHPTMDGIYGVTLRQRYDSDRYSDDGYLFLLWDFRNPSMPMIHVRTWQPYDSLNGHDDIIDIGDFNLQ